jgi:hypothetical protein
MLQTIDKKKETTMRLFSYFVALIASITFLSIVLTGCSDQSNLTAPVNNVNKNEPNWIALPQAEGMQINKTHSTTESLDGKKSGNDLIVNTLYSGGPFGTVSVRATIVWPNKNSWSGVKTFTMTSDDASCVTTFGPSMVFNYAGVFNVTYTGVDLSSINLSTVKFAYLAADGSVQYAQHEGITVDLATGTLSVLKAKIPHFSRYGFVN